MSRETTRRRILALERIFRSEQPLTIREIQRRLNNRYGICVDRKTLYVDIAELTMFLPIELIGHGRGAYYQLIPMEKRLEEQT